MKTKVIYLTNTLAQYDYERHIGEQNERLRDFFIYDASIGATIGPEVAQHFPYEVYKQVKYVFDQNQKTIRNAMNLDQVLRMPHALRFHLRVAENREFFSPSLFPAFFARTKSAKNRIARITLKDFDLTTLMGILCVAAFAKNVGRLSNMDALFWMKSHPHNSTPMNHTPLQELEETIKRIETAYYQHIGTTTLNGHDSGVQCVAVLPDRRVVSGSDDCSLRVWDADTGQCLQTLKGHTRRISCVAILSGEQIVSGSYDNTLRVWDTATGHCLTTLDGHQSAVTCVAVLPDKRLVGGSANSTLQVWNTVTCDCLQTLEGHKYGVSCVTVLPDGHVVSGSYDNTLRVWDTATGHFTTLDGHQNAVSCLAVLPDGHVVSGSKDHTLRVWDAATGTCLQILADHKNSVNCISVFHDGRVVSGSSDNTLKVWNATTGDCLQTLEGHRDEITCVAVLPDGCVVSGSSDNTLRIWNATTGECLQTLEGHTDKIPCVAVLSDGRVVSGSSDSTLRIWKTIEKMRMQLPAANSLMNYCLFYLRFLEEQRDALFSLFRRIDENTFELSLDAMKAEKKGKESDAYQALISFMQKYRYTCEPSYTIDFDWGLSSGEENMLRIFSSLYHVFDRDYSSGHYGDYKIYNNEAHIDRYDGKTECDTVLLFLDEADLTLHPEWQRRLIEILTTCIPRIYPASCVKDIQLILSTHSPLILGDIPSENITYLFNNTTKEEVPPSQIPKPTDSAPAVPSCPGETFGQNIHTILKENFFLGNGTVGAFAGNKINWIAKRLDEISRINPNSNDFNLYKEELEDLQRYIRIVAPGVLRARLEQMYRVAEAAVRTFQETIGQKSTMEKLLSEANALSADERERLIEALQKKEDKQDD